MDTGEVDTVGVDTGAVDERELVHRNPKCCLSA